MKVIYLDQYFNSPAMAGGTRSYEMARRLVRAGHEVHIVTAFRDGTAERDWFTTDEDGIVVHWLPVAYSNAMGYSARIVSFLRFAFAASLKAASLRGEVVFATSTPLTIALPGVFAARWNRIPMVFEVRDLWPEVPIAIGALRDPLSKWIAHRLERFAYRNAARVVALSPGMAEGVIRTGYPRERVTVIPNSCDLDLFSKDPVAARRFRDDHPELGDGPIILYPGTLGRVNGVEYMVHLAVNTWKLIPEARFVIFGAGSEEATVRAAAREAGVLNVNFFMYLRLPKWEVVDAFAAASVVTSFIIDLPELEANSANKFFDGLASGTPVAINHGGWQAEILEQTGAGFVLSRNPKEAAHQLEEWLGDSARLQAGGAAARRLAEERFSRDDLGHRLERVLLAAAGGARPVLAGQAV